jgi:hypothetical protein
MPPAAICQLSLPASVRPSFVENSDGIPNVLWTHTLSYSDQQILFALR